MYGTLMRGFDHPMARLLRGQRRFSRRGAVPVAGSIWCGTIRGWSIAMSLASRVHGHLFRLRQPTQLLAELDDCEGCGADAPLPAEYRRELRTITAADGTAQQAWVYLWQLADRRHAADRRRTLRSGVSDAGGRPNGRSGPLLGLDICCT
ncbi:MAG: gamma-glutamylcyclotransferase [Rhodopseudomonas palustris]|nr:gamma-glutamylcyclotransferase [Rhodopseudomonas palustris]